MTEELDAFTRAYMECALWSSTDYSSGFGDMPLDDRFTIDDFAPETRAAMECDCQAFYETYADWIAEAGRLGAYSNHEEWSPAERAGHDFWLTRNGHGAGFWDRGLGAIGDKLSVAAKSYGGVDLYVGDDGKIWA